MHAALVEQAAIWHRANPDTPLDINIVAAGFSRAGPAEVIFAHILNDVGIPDLDSAYTVEVPSYDGNGGTTLETRYARNLVDPGVGVHLVLMDPVATGVYNDGRLGLPPNVIDAHVIYAIDEHRANFFPMAFADSEHPDPRVSATYSPGPHTGIGRGDDVDAQGQEANGMGASNLEWLYNVVESTGVPVPAFPEDLRYDANDLRINDSSVGLFEMDWARVREPDLFLPDGSRQPSADVIPSLSISHEGLNLPLGYPAVDPNDSFNQPLPDIGEVPKPGDPIVVADAGDGTMTDAGPVNGYGDASSASGSSGSTPTQPSAATTGQSLTEWGTQVNPGLAQSVVDALTASGSWSPESISHFEVLPQTNGSQLIVDASGTVVATVQDAYTSADGSPAWQRVQIEGQNDAVYIPPQGGLVVPADKFEGAAVADMSNAFGAFSSLANGLGNWGSMNDAQRLSALVAFYNQIDQLGAGLAGMTLPPGADPTLLPGEVGAAAGGLAGALSLYYGLESGNDAQALSGALQLYNVYTTYTSTAAGAASSAAASTAAETAASSAAGDAAASSAASEIPYVGIALALTQVEDNPWGAVASVCACYPPYGTIVAVFINAMLMMFPDDIPTSVGEASVHIDDSGAVVVDTTVDEAGGGGTAAHWAQALAQMALGAGMSAPQAGAPAQNLPSVGYYYDPDGFNFAGSQGQLALRWTGEDGSQHQTLYDSGGMRWGPDSDPSQPDIASATPAAMGANPNGPQMPSGKDSIVLVRTAESAAWINARNWCFSTPITPKRGWTQTQACG